MRIEIECAMCGQMMPEPVFIENEKDLELKSITKKAKLQGWILEVNGDIIDAYCSKKCAK